MPKQPKAKWTWRDDYEVRMLIKEHGKRWIPLMEAAVEAYKNELRRDNNSRT